MDYHRCLYSESQALPPSFNARSGLAVPEYGKALVALPLLGFNLGKERCRFQAHGCRLKRCRRRIVLDAMLARFGLLQGAPNAMIMLDATSSVILGVCLSAACGFRVFLPALVLSTAALYFGVPLPGDLAILNNQTAFVVLLAATLFEIGAYYVPWLDNILDHIATPVAVVAGTLLTYSFLIPDTDPVLRWGIALIVGGGAAGAVQATTNITRLSSSALTFGLANPVIATIENVMALALSVMTVAFPVLAALMLGVVGFVVVFIVLKLLDQRKQKSSPPVEPPGD